ncbi:MAG TPA: RND transporter, partial [Ramlibacter sp.]|nr:RND transporter [Ramlibacter sp.]
MSPKIVVAPALAAGAAGLVFWLTGCATQPPPVEVNGGVTIPPAWTEAAPPGSAPLALWWQGFGDPVLVQLVDRSQRSNSDVRIAQANLREAR